LKTKQGEIRNLISSVNPDIIFGTETWIDSSVKDAQILPGGFNIYRNDRNLNGGGVLLAVKDTLLTSAVTEPIVINGVHEFVVYSYTLRV
jgi:hypothetical protein